LLLFHALSERLTALHRPARAKKAHPLDGLVTWSCFQKKDDDGKLGKSFQFRASSIHRRVTRGVHDSVRHMCVNYTPAHVDNVVTWFRENSAHPKPNETAEEIKPAFKKHFGCMNPYCNHTCTSFDVDHVNCEMKTANFGNLMVETRPISVLKSPDAAYISTVNLGMEGNHTDHLV
jgi:hypothetical protein